MSTEQILNQTAIEKLRKNPLLFFILSSLKYFSFGIALLLLANFVDGLTPLLLKKAIDQIVALEPLTKLYTTLAIFLLLEIGGAFLKFFWRTFYGLYHTESGEILRKNVFFRVLHKDISFLKSKSVGNLISIISQDVTVFRQTIGPGMLILIDALCTFIVIVPMMLNLSVEWTLRTLFILPIIPIMIYFSHKMAVQSFRTRQETLGKVSAFAQEFLSNIKLIKNFNQETATSKKYSDSLAQYEKISNKVSVYDGFFSVSMSFGVSLGSVVLLFIASQDLTLGAQSIGTFIAFQRYLDRLVRPASALGASLSSFLRGQSSFRRISPLLDDSNGKQDSGTKFLSEIKSVEFKDVDFTYGNSETKVLNKLNFKLENGSSLVILGPVGSGKSSIVQLLMRSYELSSGQVLINGQDIKDYTLESVRSAFSVVLQESFLFKVSVEDNLLYPQRNRADLKDILKFTEVAQIRQEIEALPQGFESEVGENGLNLSGGQRQRLCLARGLRRFKSCLVLDDALSAVDVVTEALILKKIFADKKTEQFVISVTSRPQNLPLFKNVLILEHGKVRYFGSVENLNDQDRPS